MDRSFRRAQAKLTAGVVGPSPDSEHVSRQELPVDGQPSKEFALWLGISSPNLVSMKLRERTVKLRVVGGAGGVDPSLVRFHEMSSGNSGVRIVMVTVSQISMN